MIINYDSLNLLENIMKTKQDKIMKIVDFGLSVSIVTSKMKTLKKGKILLIKNK